MGRLRALPVSAAVLAVSMAVSLALPVTPGRAADMPNYRSLPPPPPARESALQGSEIDTGWYLRGDIGYRFQHIGNSSSGDPTMVPSLASGKLDNTFTGGVGTGYKQNWLRGDMTIDYGWRSKYNATSAGHSIDGKVDGLLIMLNGYVDLGTWAGITPYVGAGIGGANVIFSGYENSTAVAPMPSTAVPTSRWNVAWAAMAGVSFTITPSLLLDVGYRRVVMGDVSGGPNGQLTAKNLTGDEIRVGIRYLLN